MEGGGGEGGGCVVSSYNHFSSLATAILVLVLVLVLGLDIVRALCVLFAFPSVEWRVVEGAQMSVEPQQR